MGIALDTIGLAATQAAAPANPVAAAGVSSDQLTVRNYNVADKAFLEAIGYQQQTHAQGDYLQVKTPSFHDDVSGITYESAESPAGFLMPREVGQLLTPGDTLQVEAQITTASVGITGTLHIYYANLPTLTARLTTWAGIRGNIKSIKPFQVDVAGAAGAWVDTVIGANADVLHSKHDYAVLGYLTDTAMTAVGLKADCTANLRACGPGVTSSLDISEYFLAMSEKTGTPHIPVFNADDRKSVYVTTLDQAGASPHITLVCAELAHVLAG